MSAARDEKYLKVLPEGADDLAPALAPWFSVSGDVDDFIFYDENDPPYSER